MQRFAFIAAFMTLVTACATAGANRSRWQTTLGIPDAGSDFGPQQIDARKGHGSPISFAKPAPRGSLCDLGDSFDHVIKLEKWFDNTSTDGLRFLLDAAGRSPPEDVGGAPGYAEYLDAIGDAAHPEHEQMPLWDPVQFDPNVVDRKAIEGAVNALSDTWKPRRRVTRSK